jgi:hypothetical protein
MKIIKNILLFSLLACLAAGCSGATYHPHPEVKTTQGCLPPNVSPLPMNAAVVGVRPVKSSEGSGYQVRYQAGDKLYDAVWINGELMAFDDKPQDPDSPVFIRKSMSSCEWERKLPGGGAEARMR